MIRSVYKVQCDQCAKVEEVGPEEFPRYLHQNTIGILVFMKHHRGWLMSLGSDGDQVHFCPDCRNGLSEENARIVQEHARETTDALTTLSLVKIAPLTHGSAWNG